MLDLTAEELAGLVASMGEPAYRGAQIYKWLMAGAGFGEMLNLPLRLRTALDERFCTGIPEIAEKYVSSVDGTVKYLFRLSDGEMIESVVMKYKYGNTVCVSSQAGCRMGCRFCASTLNGLTRNLTSGEILGQVIAVGRDTGERVSNIVLMGIGEPLDNYDNVIRFLKLVNSENGLNIGMRHISLSTCGLVDGIRRLAEEDMPLTLSVSLHAPEDAQRSAIMPVNNKWGVGELLGACSDYFKRTGRRISFEYALIAGKNDSVSDACRLASVLKKHLGEKTPIHVNLIPVNPVAERGLSSPNQASVNAFQTRLTKSGINATVRRRLGPDINASCGQLRAKRSKQTDSGGQ